MSYIITQTPTITAGAYSAGDAIGGKLTFSGCPEDGVIHGATLIDKAEQSTAAVYLVLFDADFTAVNDNAAFSVTAGEQSRIIGVINFAAADYVDIGGDTVNTKMGLGLPYRLTETDTAKRARIYGQLFTTGTPTYGSTSDIIVRLAVLPYKG